MQGIYVPYWTFDADTEIAVSRRTRHRPLRHPHRDPRRQAPDGPRAKVRWRGVSGRVARFFDDVLVLASTSLPKRFTDALEPWDLRRWSHTRRNISPGSAPRATASISRQGFAQARAKMDAVIARDVRFDIGGDRQRIHDIDTGLSAVTFKHILLPVWLAAYRFRGRTYRFVVNARTGRVQGERPWSVWKIAVAVALGLAVAGGIGYALALERGGF